MTPFGCAHPTLGRAVEPRKLRVTPQSPECHVVELDSPKTQAVQPEVCHTSRHQASRRETRLSN